MKKFIKGLVVAGLFVTGASLPVGVSNATSSTEVVSRNFSIEVDYIVQGCDEPIHLTGWLHYNDHFTDNKNKSLVVLHGNPQGIKGVGLHSGAEYNGVGSTICIINDNLQSYNTTYVDNFHLIGKGKTPNRTVHINYHLTENANGEITAELEHISIECKDN